MALTASEIGARVKCKVFSILLSKMLNKNNIIIKICYMKCCSSMSIYITLIKFPW